jgi:hypothetical protein
MSVGGLPVPSDDEESRLSVDAQLAVLRVKMDQLIRLNETRGEDHETRIRKLEERRFPLQVMAVLISAAALIAAVVGILLTHK